LSNPRELSKIFTADTEIVNESEMITMVNAASAHVMQEAMTYTDNATPDLTPAIQAASAAAVAYTDQELSNIDLTSTIITASAAAASYTDEQLSVIDLTSTIVTASAAAVNYLVGGAPGALDTLNELAAALGDDENFATTVTSELASKLNISTASASYLTQSNASSLYLTQTSASTLYEPSIPYSSASPSEPSSGTLWIDSSASTSVIKVYTGSHWDTIGNIAQVSASARPVSAAFGTIIYNTTNKSFESYTEQGWYTFFTQSPVINSISVTSGATSANRIDPNFAAIINISGQNFDSPTVVMNAFTVPSSQVSHTSTQITIDTGVNVVPPNTYTNFIVTNADGQATSASTSIVVNAEPIFGATSTYSATYATAFSINNGFTDEESNAMTYSLASGSLPPGSTLNSSTGVLSGTYNEVYTNAPSVLYSPTIRATDSIGNSTDATLNITVTVPFLFRQIINYGYTAAGYKDNVPWRNVNIINVSTDISTNLGDLLQNSANYTSGAHNRDRAFIWGTGGVGAFTNTSVFNMRTNSTYTKQSAMDTPVTVGDAGTVQQDETAKAWIANGLGSSVVARFNLATETAGTTFGLSFLQNDGTGAGGVFTETAGYYHADSTSMKLVFATETMSSGVRIGAHGQQKSMPTKLNVGYAGNEGSYNGGFNLRKWNLTTDSQITTYTKPIGDSGEENMTMGQYHQYMLGMYNAQGQNNRSWRWSYNTDTGYEGGASMQPTGAPGRSSGHAYWRD
jgi:hypothetical protein